MTPEVQAALEYFRRDWARMATTATKHGTALAAEVRRLEAAQKGGPCETCKHRFNYKDDHGGVELVNYYCGKVSLWGHSLAQTSCKRLGGGCWAWEKREGA